MKMAQFSEQAPNNGEEEKIVIIDIGEGYTKVGFAGDEQPIIFPTMTGKEKYTK
jgi:actin-related protein